MSGPYQQQPGYPQQSGGYPGQWAPPPPHKNRTNIIVLVVLGVLLLVGGIITAVSLTSRGNSAATVSTTAAAASTTESASTSTTKSSSSASDGYQIGECLGQGSNGNTIQATCGSASSSFIVAKKVKSIQECAAGYTGATIDPSTAYCFARDLVLGDCLDSKYLWKMPCATGSTKVVLMAPGPHSKGVCHPNESTPPSDTWRYVGAEPNPRVACLGPK